MRKHKSVNKIGIWALFGFNFQTDAKNRQADISTNGLGETIWKINNQKYKTLNFVTITHHTNYFKE